VAHRDHDGLDGEARGGRSRRNRRLLASEKSSSTEILQGDLVRFLELVEQVEDGGHHGGHGKGWGGSERRQ
jgi:hypothetical protein